MSSYTQRLRTTEPMVYSYSQCFPFDSEYSNYQFQIVVELPRAISGFSSISG
jgi:hypothetical protein